MNNQELSFDGLQLVNIYHGGGGVGRLDSVTIKFTNPHRGAGPFSLYFVLPYRPSIDW